MSGDTSTIEPLNGYVVEIISHCDHYEQSPEQFGHWEESYSNYFSNIWIKPKNGYSDVSSSLDLKVGDVVYVVWVEYSTGDSFGWADRRGTEAIGIFNNYEDAEKLRKLIKDSNTEGKHVYNKLIFDSSDGQHLEIYAGTWTGYFERLDSVHIEHTAIVPPREKR